MLNKFYKGNDRPFDEKDFQWISQLGFNFVRLPMDYRVWIKEDNWRQFDESVLTEVDQAVTWGQKYGIHVCINFHRAPGYTVANPKEARSLWTDAEAQEVCALHWTTFAKRYKGIPNQNLSFNLVNEPGGISPQKYAEVAGKLINAIRKEDPDRLIISDGLQWGQSPCMDLPNGQVAQAFRGYQPFALTHYKASWVDNAGQWSEPVWPVPMGWGGFLYGPDKGDLCTPMAMEVNLSQPAKMTLHVGTVSNRSHLVAEADNKILWEHTFKPGPGQGEWKRAVSSQHGVYQNIYDRDYTFPLPAGMYGLFLKILAGDWMTITSVKINCGDQVYAMNIKPEWAKPHYLVRFRAEKGLEYQDHLTADWLKDNYFQTWIDLKNKPAGVMVGEWGSHRYTPHDVVLRWMEDCLKIWRQEDIGWALWNFRGSFGILDSGRSDVKYEDFHGHKLDRKMLDLLQKY